MAGCKHSITKTLAAAAVVALLLPRLALGEYGICPPYSATFGPEDPPEDIELFIAEINLRPGGGTVNLGPGNYEGIELPPITGVVCVQPLHPDHEIEIDFLSDGPIVEAGGMLTLKVGNFEGLGVAAGGKLFANNLTVYWIENDGVAYLHDVTNGGVVQNGGTMVWRGGAAIEVRNSGWALFDQVWLSGWADCPTDEKCYGFYPAVSNTGVVTIHRSVITEDCGPHPDWLLGCTDSISNFPGATAYVVGSTVAAAISNEGGIIEIGQSISVGCATVESGYNVFSADCPISQPTSVQADPLFIPGSFELAAGSPAIDRIPLALCSETDMLGRERTDGDGDGVVACDSGALEYGHASMPVTARTTPYWRETGTLDLSRDAALFVTVFSTADFDAIDILFDTVDVEGLDEYALRGPGIGDTNRDGILDIVVWYRLDRMDPLVCGSYEQRFEAMTGDGRVVDGQLRYDVVGCSP